MAEPEPPRPRPRAPRGALRSRRAAERRSTPDPPHLPDLRPILSRASQAMRQTRNRLPFPQAAPPAALRRPAHRPNRVVWSFSCQAVVLGCADSFLFGAGKAVFRPVACDQVAGARGGGQGTETLAKLGGFAA